MNISAAGLKLIEWFEWGNQFNGAPYQDAVGVWTIGYGHTHDVGPSTPPITQQQAVVLLQQDVDDEYGAAVNDLRLPLNQNQFDATTSFVYNLGPGVLETSSTFGSYLRVRDWVAAANSMMGYVYADGRVLPGLVTRRQMERALFLAPVAKPPEPLNVLTHNERRLVAAYTQAVKHPHLHAHELKGLRAALVESRQAVWLAAVKGLTADGKHLQPGWDIENRNQRYRILSALIPATA
jgi:lysozyme